ncbi:MAG: hypothetical protein WHX52_12525 [Anaerolineae bacterium]
MDFNEAEQRFRFLEDQRKRGVITLEQYRAELNLLRVTDAQGRLWMPQERTGQWYVHEGGQWRAAQPPTQTPPPPPPPPAPVAPQPRPQPVQPQPRPQPVQPQLRPQPRPQPVQPQPQPRPQPAQVQPHIEKGGGCGKSILYLVLWAVIWFVIAVVVFLIWGREEPGVLLGVGLAALISLVIMLATLSSAWSGTVVDMRVEQVRSTDDDGYTQVDDVLFAYVRRDNGKVKKMRAMSQWQVGDRLEKKRGEGHVRHYPARS